MNVECFMYCMCRIHRTAVEKCANLSAQRSIDTALSVPGTSEPARYLITQDLELFHDPNYTKAQYEYGWANIRRLVRGKKAPRHLRATP